jgi:hypothetical protein
MSSINKWLKRITLPFLFITIIIGNKFLFSNPNPTESQRLAYYTLFGVLWSIIGLGIYLTKEPPKK